MRLLAVIAVVVLALLSHPASAQGKRVALVIGNSAYQHTPTLTNPKNDAADVAKALRKHGFQVIEAYDQSKSAMERTVRDFADSLQGSTVAAFFYAGHGLQVGGHNYLVPVDARLSTASALDFEMIRLDLVHRTMEREAPTNILFLDACRDNPLARNLARAMGTRSADIGRGLAAVESGVGTLISFSTQPGNVALDGAGRNSPFAGALTKHVTAAGDDLSAILIAVRNDVMSETKGKQVPWEHSALTKRFYFAAPPANPPAAPPPAGQVFTARDAELVAAFASKYQFMLPPFAIENPDDGLAEEGRRFLGVWSNEQGFGDGAGRRWMLLVMQVDRGLTVAGIHAFGPEARAGSDRHPPGYVRFVGRIRGDMLTFDGGYGSSFAVTYSANDRLSVAAKMADGKQHTMTIHRIRAGSQVVPLAEPLPAATHMKSYWLRGVWRGQVAGLNDKNLGDVRTLTVYSIGADGTAAVVWSHRADGAGVANADMKTDGETLTIITTYKSIVKLRRTGPDRLQGTFRTRGGRTLNLTMNRV